MKVTLAKDQPMEHMPRVKMIFKNYVKRHDFLVKCRPQNVIMKEGENAVTKSIVGQLGALSGRIKVFMGPSSYITDQNEYFCGLWVRDLGTFLKKVFITVEHDTAELIVTVKHLGQEIGRGDFRLDLSRDSSKPRTSVKCKKMCQIGPGQGRHGFQEFFRNVTSESFTVTMVLKFDIEN